METSGICCFCNQSIKITIQDPGNIYVFGNWNKKINRRPLKQFAYHFICLKKKLYKNCKLQHENKKNKFKMTCCFCNKIFKFFEINIFNFYITDYYAISKNDTFIQMHYFHLPCLKKYIHKFFREFFIEKIFLLKKEIYEKHDI